VAANDSVELVDITPGFAGLTIVKDEAEIKSMKDAAQLTVATLKHSFVARFEEAVDEEKKISHSKLSDDVENDMSDMKKLKLHKESATVKNVNMDVLEPCYPPIIQSAGEYDLRPSAFSNDKNLHHGVITVSLGARYKSYCSNIGRTYLIDPDKEMEGNYAILLATQQVCLDALRPGKPLSEVYAAAENFIKKKKPDLMKNFTKDVGFGMGLEFRDSTYRLNAKNSNTIEDGMVFNLGMGFSNLTRSKATDPKKKTYALFLADTVVVQLRGEPLVLTDTGEKKESASKKYSDVSYYLEDEEEKDEKVKNSTKESVILGRDAKRTTKVTSAMNEAERAEAQDKASAKLREEQEKRLRAQANAKSKSVQKVEDICAYSRPTDYPDAIPRKSAIQVDTRNEVIFVPINSIPVPFHISLIKNVSKSGGEEAGSWTFLRIIFNTPSSVTMAKDMSVSQQIIKNQDQTFISEVSFKSKNKSGIEQNFRLINELRKRIRTREVEKANRAAVPVQEALIINRRGAIPRLTDLKMRPHASGRKSNGVLESHENGFRFTTQRGEKVDILYDNIKHALHQPAEKELIVLIHFHLKFPILIGKKKQIDIQFYSEIGDLAGESLDMRRGSAWDPDEIEEEQREREYRQRLNKEYEEFIKRVENKAVGFEFDIPYIELSFDGVPFRESVTIAPSVYTVCALVSTPFFVATLEDVEIVHFERIETGTALRSFDMVFVYKDYSKPIQRITSVPSEKFEQIKNWLTSIEIKYYEGPATLNWKKILDHIVKNLEDFIQDGGWDAILNLEESEGEGGEGEESDDPDSDFGPEEADSEDEEVSDSDEYSDEDEGEEEVDESGSEEESDEEAGKSWEELEREANKEDRRRDRDEQEESRFNQTNKKHKRR